MLWTYWDSDSGMLRILPALSQLLHGLTALCCRAGGKPAAAKLYLDDKIDFFGHVSANSASCAMLFERWAWCTALLSVCH